MYSPSRCSGLAMSWRQTLILVLAPTDKFKLILTPRHCDKKYIWIRAKLLQCQSSNFCAAKSIVITLTGASKPDVMLTIKISQRYLVSALKTMTISASLQRPCTNLSPSQLPHTWGDPGGPQQEWPHLPAEGSHAQQQHGQRGGAQGTVGNIDIDCKMENKRL